MSKYVSVKMYKASVSDSDSDYYPFVDECDGAEEVWEVFYLNDDGQWIQEYLPPLISIEHNKIYGDDDFDFELHKEVTTIKGLTGANGEKLLKLLNEQTAKQQMEDDGVSESDVVKGTVILNSMDQMLV